MRKMRAALMTAAFCAIATGGSAVEITADSVIVADARAPAATRLAVDELNGFLEKIFGTPLLVTNAVPPGRTAILLGAAAQRRVGMSAPAARDGFVVEATDEAVCIFGNDDDFDTVDELHASDAPAWQSCFRRGTLFGVYEFLEQKAGVRMYFPGELGTVVPRANRLVMVKGSNLDARPSAPAFSVRRHGYYDFAVSEPPAEVLQACEGDEIKAKRLNWYRLRMETEHVMCNHNVNLPTNHCLSATTWHDCLVADACEFFDELRQDPPQVRASCEAFGGRVYKLTPRDGFTSGLFSCPCAYCQGLRSEGFGPNWKTNRNFSTREVWRRTKEMAEAITKVHPEALFSQIAYMSYADVEQVDVDIPTNVLVFVARRGPWAEGTSVQAAETNDVRAWHDKIGRRVSLWNYPGKRKKDPKTGEVSIPNLDAPGIPQMAPRAWASYYKSVAQWINGAFAECESDRWIYNYLNLYVFSRVCWDPAADVETILAEHHAKMFGAAADDMAAFFNQLETSWMQVVSQQVVTNISSVYCYVPPPEELRRTIYSPAALAELDHDLRAAAGKVAVGSLEARRVAFFRRRFFEPLREAMGEGVESVPLMRFGLVASTDEVSARRLCEYRNADEVIATNRFTSAAAFAGELIESHACDESWRKALTEVWERMRTATGGRAVFLLDAFPDRCVLQRLDAATGVSGEAWTNNWGNAVVKLYRNHSSADEVCREISVTQGQRIGALPTPESPSDDYRFGGWYRDRVGTYSPPTGRVTEDAVVPGEETSLYARWYGLRKAHINIHGCERPNQTGNFNGNEPLSPLSAVRWFGMNNFNPPPASEYHPSSLMSGPIGAGESAEFYMDITNAYQISFTWYVSCEKEADALVFEVDGSEYARISGTEEGWQHVTVEIAGDGNHRNLWRYTKNRQGTAGLDAAFVDDILFCRPVTFDTNGGTQEAFRRYYKLGYLINESDAAYAASSPDGFPDLDGAAGFLGWYADRNGTVEVKGTDRVRNDSHTLYAKWASAYKTWAGRKGLAGANAAWDAKPPRWGGIWANAFVYTYGEGLADGTRSLMCISFDASGRPVVMTTPVVEGHDDFTPVVIGTDDLRSWSSSAELERSGDIWTLPVGVSSHFFRVRLSE